jgi:hypothetical protein
VGSSTGPGLGRHSLHLEQPNSEAGGDSHRKEEEERGAGVGVQCAPATG